MAHDIKGKHWPAMHGLSGRESWPGAAWYGRARTGWVGHG
jgi:hypothetical protein